MSIFSGNGLTGGAQDGMATQQRVLVEGNGKFKRPWTAATE